MPRVNATSMKINGSSGKAGVKEAITAAVLFQPAPQIGPTLNLVDRLIFDELFQDHSRTVPVDPLQNR